MSFCMGEAPGGEGLRVRAARQPRARITRRTPAQMRALALAEAQSLVCTTYRHAGRTRAAADAWGLFGLVYTAATSRVPILPADYPHDPGSPEFAPHARRLFAIASHLRPLRSIEPPAAQPGDFLFFSAGENANAIPGVILESSPRHVLTGVWGRAALVYSHHERSVWPARITAALAWGLS